jgi:GT2 family glycosyltransferase
MDISIVVISFNSANFLKDNIASLLGQTVPFKEIIVVDNNSRDNSLEILRQYKDIQLIAQDTNTGYAAGANTGIRAATADLVMVANADITLQNDFNRLVIDRFESNREIALLSPLLLRFDKITIDSAGQRLSSSLYPQEIGYGQPRQSLDLSEGPVFSVCGAATVFSRRALEKLEMNGQYYDEDFFIFWEDLDIGWRANNIGLLNYFYPEAIVYHFRSATLKRSFISRFSLALGRSPLVKYHLVKNRYLTLIKNFQWKKNWRAFPFALCKDIIWISALTLTAPKNIIKLLASGGYMIRAFKKRQMIKEKMP